MAEALKVLIVIERLERSFDIVRCQSVLLIRTISFSASKIRIEVMVRHSCQEIY
jgi:hypothetical protein